MSPLIYFILSGSTFFIGAGLIIAAVCLPAFRAGTRIRMLSTSIAVFGCASMLVSGTPVPLWLYIVTWAVFVLWVAAEHISRTRRSWRVGFRISLIVLLLLQAGIELPHGLAPAVPERPFGRLVVIGDSVSAPLHRSSKVVWPDIVADHTRVHLLNLSRAGATIDSALDHQVPDLDDSPCLLVMEIGGNDLLYRYPPDRFENSLERLMQRVCRSDRTTVLFELPTPPFESIYADIQRRLAARHGVVLVPRRYFIRVIRVPENTEDGVHLTAAGQACLAEVVEQILGRRCARTPSPRNI